MMDRESNQTSRDRLSRIGHHFLSDKPPVLQLSLIARQDDTVPLRAADLARAVARLGRTVAVVEPEQATILYFRALPGTLLSRPYTGTTEPRSGFERYLEYIDTEPPRNSDIMIIESTPSDRPGSSPFALLAVPAQDSGMRRAWLDLKSLAAGRSPPRFGITITGAADLYEAEGCFERFAAAAERFLDIEIGSYAFLLQSEQDRDQQLGNIAALLLADTPPKERPSPHEKEPEERT